MRGTTFVRNGAVTPRPSRECDISFVKGRPKSAQQLRDSTEATSRAQSVTVPSSRVTRKCRSTGLRSPPPPLKRCPKPSRGIDFHDSTIAPNNIEYCSSGGGASRFKLCCPRIKKYHLVKDTFSTCNSSKRFFTRRFNR